MKGLNNDPSFDSISAFFLVSTVFYAHSGKNVDKSDWQLLSDHLNKVAGIAKQNASYFGGQKLAFTAGILHDLGKYSEEFAQRLEGGNRVDHATAGAKIAVEKWGVHGRILAYAIAGHHAGLANGIDEGVNRSSLEARLKKAVPQLNAVWKSEIELQDQLSFPDFISTETNAGFQLAFLIRMVFSCLVDADYLDTEAFYFELESKQCLRGGYPSFNKLKATLDRHLVGLASSSLSKSPGVVNNIRQEILEYAKLQATLPLGLFSLTVPTGGGKTLTSLAFALDHLSSHAQKLRRVIYVIPFTSIIEQNAGVFRNVFQEFGDDIVLEHHSAYDDSGFKVKDETKQKLRSAMENWDAPIVVTTAVQFFESLFADRASKCRKLHNISGSVIILDEAQMLPLKLLRPTMAAIDELARNYSCSVVMCTATQPALLQPNFLNGFENVREIAPDPPSLFRQLNRVTVSHVGVQTDQQLVNRIDSNDQILVIVNNRRQALTLNKMMGESGGHFQLTTLMCATHRKKKLKEIRGRLASNELCKVVSTSLIEAGVDVDFPIVMRSEAGLDSVAQAAGRCNREGKAKANESRVLIFASPEWKAPPELDQFAASMRSVLRNHRGNLLSPEAITCYFEDVYWKQESELDAKKILTLFRDHFPKMSFPFQNIANKYRIIESFMHPIIIPYDKVAESLIRTLEVSDFVGSTARKLQPYLVQVPEKAFFALKSVGAIVTIAPERFGDQFWKLNNIDLYSQDSGLDWADPTFLDSNSMVN